MISATIQVHYNPTSGYENPTGTIITPEKPFASLRFGPQVSLLITDPATLDLIARAASTLAESLRDARDVIGEAP